MPQPPSGAPQTLATYRLECRRLLHDATGKFWSNAELNDYINDARYRVCADTGCLRRLVTAYLTAEREEYAIGALTGALVTAGGAGYTTASVAVVGDGSGATATAVLASGGTPSGGGVTAVSVVSTGLGYYTPPAVAFGPPGTGAAATASLQLVGWQVNAFGAGYAAGDVLTLIGGTFTRPARLMVLSPGLASNYAIIDAGDYSFVPGVHTTAGGINVTGPLPFFGGSGAGAQIFCYWGVGAVTVSAAGSGYVTAPTTIAVGGSGNVAGTLLASVNPVVGGGTVTSITIDEPGAGYSFANLVITGDGAGATATAGLIPASTLDIMNISPIWGNQRPPVNYMPWTEFNAKLRVYMIQPQLPRVWSRYGSSGGSVFLQPVPDQAYVTEFDTAVLPAPLESDATVDVIQYPYTSPVAYYACWKAKQKQQSYAEGEVFLRDYGKQVLRAQASIQMRRVPNPYAGYTGG